MDWKAFSERTSHGGMDVMGYSDFPHTLYGKREPDDLTEFIHLYKKLVGDYDTLVTQINALNTRLNEYEASVNNKITSAVTSAVEIAIRNEMSGYRAEIEGIKRTINDLDSEVEALKAEDRKIYDEINAVRVAANEAITSLDLKVTLLINGVNDLIASTKEELINKIEEDDNKVRDEFDHKIAGFEVSINSYYVRSKQYTDEKIADVVKMIDDLQYENVSDKLKWLWDNGCNFGGYNAFQWYMDTEITAGEWSKMNFTAVDWYVRGREVFGWFDRIRYIVSPFTGKRSDVRKVLLELINQLKRDKALSASEYDALGLTAEEYDSKNISAYDYDWNGKEILKDGTQ